MQKNKISKVISTVALIAIMAIGLLGCNETSNSTTDSNVTSTTNNTSETKNTGPIIIVWYPNESATDYQPARDEFGRIFTQATGRPVEHKLTTDYAIAIESIASGSTDVCFMGGAGYIEARNKNPMVEPLFVNSGASGTLKDAIYYSWLATLKGNEGNYKDGDKFSIKNIQGKKMSFVSNSSTSGFKVPTKAMLDFFKNIDQWKDIKVDDLLEGGSNAFFSEVLFGGSHQGSGFNLMSGKCDIAAFCDTELAPYADLKEGVENKAGAVYAINQNASAPFDTVTGKEFVIFSSIPVLNGPFAYNKEKFTQEEVRKIQEAFMSDEVANNTKIFVDKASKEAGYVGLWKKTDKERILMVEDSWYDPIREMGK